MRTLPFAILISVLASVSHLLAAGPEIVFADFEGSDYGAWKVEGKAFGNGPAQGTLPGEKPVTGFMGHGLVNSASGGDGATGKLTSPEFVIHHACISFLIGAGGWEGKTCMNLLVDSKVVRTATGPHNKPGGSGALIPAFWEVNDLTGKTAHLEIVDEATGDWGHITVDQIVFTDVKPSGAAAATQATSAPPSEAVGTGAGELLYNGIQLPAEWPPHYKPKPMQRWPVPYLEHPPAVIPIDVGRQLLVDDFLVESSTLKREFHYPQRYAGNPILKPETPAELNNGKLPLAAMISDGAWYDPKDQLFKLFYQAGWRDGTMLATSKDGLHWERPKLDVVEGTNRILPKRDHLVRHGTGICLDLYTHDAQQRFKMLIYEDTKKKTSSYVSPDGVHWNFATFLPECGDNSTMFYNPFRKKWVFSLRLYRGGRARDYREHEDFVQGTQWTKAEQYPWAGVDDLDVPDADILALMPKPEVIQKEAQEKGVAYAELLKKYRADYGDPTQLYNLEAMPYESLMLGVFGVHRGPTNSVCEKLKRPKITDLEFGYSRDGFHWERPDRTPFLACTRKEGDWDRGYLHSAVGICNVVGDKLYFFYSGWSGISPALGADMYAGGSTGVAFLRRDGFASLNAGAQPGTLITRTLTFQGKHLFVNLDAPHGELRAELLDEMGKPIAPYTLENCLAITGDSTHQPVSWKGADDLAALAGHKIKLRFQLRNARLYSFWVTPDAGGASYGYVAAGGPGFAGPMDKPKGE